MVLGNIDNHSKEPVNEPRTKTNYQRGLFTAKYHTAVLLLLNLTESVSRSFPE